MKPVSNSSQYSDIANNNTSIIASSQTNRDAMAASSANDASHFSPRDISQSQASINISQFAPMRAPSGEANLLSQPSLPMITANTTAQSPQPFCIDIFLSAAADESSFSDAMSSLYQHLAHSDQTTRQQTLRKLWAQQSSMGETAFSNKFHFRFPGKGEVMAGGIEFKSVFASEAWSRVMLKAIEQSPEAIANKTLVDVGCGNFCFGRAAIEHGAAAAYGVDINPDAILNAKINQVLFFGKVTQDVQVSDLLAALDQKQIKVDTIIACIPQILNLQADDSFVDSAQLAQATLADRERFSHQAPPAGGDLADFDRFGLGLVARLLQQAPKTLKPGGQLLMNIAGRPGQAQIDRLFQRFGYQAKPVVTEVFAQQTTGDEAVDLSFFVTLEAKHGINFRFYTDQACQQHLTATQAQALLEAGKPVYHELTCYSVKPNSN